ncbi:transporter [Achromobacter sp. F4_2707]|uniref:transporter n=1 Tax=Achromobacter sp. F4_2707 TaxID=3114286 RepID=UPI0039C65628
MKVKQVLPNTTLLALCFAALPAHAQEEEATIQRLEQRLYEQQQMLDQTRESLERLRMRLQVPGGPAYGPGPTGPQGAEARPVQADYQNTVQEPVGQAPTHTQEEDAAKVAPILDQPGILTPRGRFTLEPSIQYDYSSNNQVNLIGFSVLPAILIGLIDVREVDTSTVMASVSVRYGLTNRLELNAKIPYVYSSQDTIMRPLTEGASNNEVFSSSGGGIGDVEVGVRYQFNDGGPNRPYYIGSLTAVLPTGKGPFDISYATDSTYPGGMPVPEEQPTGSGFYALDAGILAIYPSDPVVFFGGLNYTWRPSQNVDKTIGAMRIGDVDPGDSIKANFGMGMSLNEKSSLSLGYQHTYIRPTKYDGNSAADSPSIQVGQFLVGFGYQLSPKTNVNLTLGIGVTRYAPDAQVILRIPISF